MIKNTIVIPYYNSENTIERLLDSIKNADGYSPVDTEILIIDDFSDKPYACSTCEAEVIRLDRNTGPSYARNRGLEKANGEWVVFADSDDIFAKNVFPLLENSIEEFPDTDVFTFQYVTQFADGMGRIEEERQGVRKPYVFGNAYRKSKLTELDICFDEYLRYLEDCQFNDLINRYAVCGYLKLQEIQVPNYFHLFNENSMTNSQPEKNNPEEYLKSTIRAKSYLINDIVKHREVDMIYNAQLKKSDVSWLYFCYLASDSVDLGDYQYDLMHIVRLLYSIHKSLIPSVEDMEIREREAMFWFKSIPPRIGYDEYITNFLSKEDQ